MLGKDSTNDIDILIFPLTTAEQRHSALTAALESAGLDLRWPKHKVWQYWARIGSHDRKHVETWAFDGQKVDIFFLS